jgi:FkbM family methyltransferase
MQKIGSFWVPDLDLERWRNRRKAKRLYGGDGSGPKIADLEEALRYVRRWTVAIDGGANVGAYSRVMMQRFDRVLAFEPAPDTYAALARNLEEWGASNVEPRQQALSDRAESVRLAAPPRRRSLSRAVVGVGDIPAVRIDELGLPDLAFLKLDLEGYESRALGGAVEALRRFRPLVMFEDKQTTGGRAYHPGGAHDLLRSLGARLVARIGRRQEDWIYGFGDAPAPGPSDGAG